MKTIGNQIFQKHLSSFVDDFTAEDGVRGEGKGREEWNMVGRDGFGMFGFFIEGDA